jgi:hypothetical protein
MSELPLHVLRLQQQARKLEEILPPRIPLERDGITLPGGTDNYLVHVNISRLLDRERNSAGDGIRRNRELVPGLSELGS